MDGTDLGEAQAFSFEGEGLSVLVELDPCSVHRDLYGQLITRKVQHRRFVSINIAPIRWFLEICSILIVATQVQQASKLHTKLGKPSQHQKVWKHFPSELSLRCCIHSKVANVWDFHSVTKIASNHFHISNACQDPIKPCNHQNLDKTLTRWLNGSLCVDGSNLRSQFRLHSLARDASDFLARSLNTRDYQQTPSEQDFQNSVRNQTPNTNHLFSFLHKSNTFPYIFDH